MRRILLLSVVVCGLFLAATSAAELDEQKLRVAHIISVLETSSHEDAGYQSVRDIGNDITTLKTQLDQDQIDDDTQYAADKARIEAAIQVEEDGIAADKAGRQIQKDKLTALKEERALIEKIYQSDRAAYLSRISKQAELVSTLESLVESTRTGLLENPTVPENDLAGTRNVFAQMKELGHGHPIEALVQVMKLFTKEDANQLVERFSSLEDAVIASQKIDNDKEDHNQKLYAILSEKIDNILIPETQQKINDFNASIKNHRKVIADLVEELRRITEIYNFRTEERKNAISYTKQASEKLQAELEGLISSETYVRQK